MNFKPDDWNANAQEYAKIPVRDGPLMAPCQAMLKDLTGALPLSESTAVLDVGCGPGTAISMFIDDYGPQIPTTTRLIASDFSSAMVDMVRNRQKQEAANPLWEKLETAVYDAQDLSGVKDGELSHVMGSLVYFMLPDGRKGLSEAHRVLQPGGAFALTSWSEVEWIEILNLAALRVRSFVPKGFDIMGPWRSVEGVKEELEAVGFKDVQARYVDVFMDVTDPTKFVDGFIRSKNPGAVMVVGDFSLEELDRTCEEWNNIVKERYPNPPRKIKGVAVVTSTRK
ncbi:S-adenosyl-L-methionine-dependent methyltransferase [Glonium stellatum]|uniref:S-adenosyl-L-methionine-dependent methyltransferase n=1 Tax=Glonium stellatum TaxID=574774 RepID=A0A8E2JV56_9PEZI|nr:S-adenosyl-L-methionine-dependent methyltransferase [Glonium stellatum]